jgi:hypothetical protein
MLFLSPWLAGLLLCYPASSAGCLLCYPASSPRIIGTREVNVLIASVRFQNQSGPGTCSIALLKLRQEAHSSQTKSGKQQGRVPTLCVWLSLLNHQAGPDPPVAASALWLRLFSLAFPAKLRLLKCMWRYSFKYFSGNDNPLANLFKDVRGYWRPAKQLVWRENHETSLACLMRIVDVLYVSLMMRPADRRKPFDHMLNPLGTPDVGEGL